MSRLSVACWKWGNRFTATHVNALRAALQRCLRLPHELVCVTEDPRGLHPNIRVISMPGDFAHTARCRRRMQGFSRDFAWQADRLLYIDIDVVLVDDITPIVNRPEPIVCWKVGHAGVFSGSFILADAGALDGAWRRFAAAPDDYPNSLPGIASDQAMVNDWLRTQPPVPYWTEADGFVTYYGRGYQRLEHLGVGPRRRALPSGARIVVLGGADLHVLEQPLTYSWVREHYLAQAV